MTQKNPISVINIIVINTFFGIILRNNIDENSSNKPPPIICEILMILMKLLSKVDITDPDNIFHEEHGLTLSCLVISLTRVVCKVTFKNNFRINHKFTKYLSWRVDSWILIKISPSNIS